MNELQTETSRCVCCEVVMEHLDEAAGAAGEALRQVTLFTPADRERLVEIGRDLTRLKDSASGIAARFPEKSDRLPSRSALHHAFD